MIAKGVAVGETVVTDGQMRLSAGAQVVEINRRPQFGGGPEPP